jgi:hypothetical protein
VTSSVGQAGYERFARDTANEDNLYYADPETGKPTLLYAPYPKLLQYHRSRAKYRLAGGAAGGGKTLGLLMDHMMEANSFEDQEQAKQVHTLLLRRTHPKLEDTVITRFREKFPREVYKAYNEQKKIITWHNGAQTHFGSMQYEHDAYGWQGQWLKIDFDEICEFTFKQWTAISAWNRCPVSPFATKGGAGNPIGPGAGWCKAVFVDHVPYEEMDQAQRGEYNAADYEYFGFTYRDNPIYANDPTYIAGLQNYPEAERRALMLGEWGVAGGYFSGAWDPNSNVYDDETVEIRPWHKRWMGGDWGFDHWSTCYWCFMDDFGIVRIYKEYVTRQEPPETLAESIIKNSFDEDGKLPKFEHFYYSHDAFHQKTDANTIAVRMGSKLKAAGLPFPQNAGTDKVGREQLFYQLLKNKVHIGETADGHPILMPALQIARSCRRLIQNIPLAPRDEGTELNREKIAQFPGLDMIDGAGHALYGRVGKPHEKPYQVRLAEALKDVPIEGTGRYIKHLELNRKERETGAGVFYLGRRNPRRH